MDSWDKRFFVTELKPDTMRTPWSPTFSEKEGTRVLRLGDDVLKGAFYMSTAWFWPGKWTESNPEEKTVKAHKHEFDETIAYIGTDPKDPHDLGGEIEVWVDGKKNILNKSFIAFIPAGIVHGPLRILRIDRPIFHFTAGMGTKYT